MGYQPFMIANTRVGMERDLEPWLLPNDAYPDLEDCYLWRGRVKRRLGYNQIGRLQRQIGTTDGSGNATITITFSGSALPTGSSSFIIGTDFFQDPGGASPVTLLTNSSGSATLNRSTGVLTVLGSQTMTAVIYQPGLPVMGLPLLETTTLDVQTLLAMDTIYSYLYQTSSGTFIDDTSYKSTLSPRPQFIWHGPDYQQFWSYNYQSAMFASNDMPGLDGLRFTTLTHGSTTVLNFASDPTPYFKIGEYAFIVPDATTTFDFTYPSGLRQIPIGGGIISGTSATTVSVTVNSTGDSNTGTLFNLVRQIGAGDIGGTILVGDGIKWRDQDTTSLASTGKPGWENFQPLLTYASNANSTYLQGALMIFPYRGRLVMLNTFEGTLAQAKIAQGQPNCCPNFAQRARWSQSGTVYYNQPVPANYQGGIDPQAWRSDTPGKGGFYDAPTLEEIVSAEFVKDTLIVYFESSTWALRYTGNELLPFVWERVNTELGSISTFSTVPFDRACIAVGNVGIHACDTVNVKRIDQKIPDETQNIQVINNGVQRVSGIRDYFQQLIYWSIPYTGFTTLNYRFDDQVFTYPNKLIVYNYIDDSFAFFNDSFTCFGYWQPSSSQSPTWSAPNPSQNDLTWEDASMLWNAGQLQAEDLTVAAGNQCGFVLSLQQQTANADSLFISQLANNPNNTVTVTVINHNLVSGQYVKVTNASGTKGLLNKIFFVSGVIDANNFLIQTAHFTGSFTGNGTISVMNNFSILTKKFNPIIAQDAQVRLGRMDCYVDNTYYGQVQINLFINEDYSTPINQPGYIQTSQSLPALSISNITAANPVVVSVPAGSSSQFKVKDVVFFRAVNGMIEISELSGIITAVTPGSPDLITVNIDGSGFTAYTSGGTLIDVSTGLVNNLNTYPQSTYAASPDTTLEQDKLWKRIQFHDISQLFQFQITLNDFEMRSQAISLAYFELHGLIMYFSKAGRLINV